MIIPALHNETDLLRQMIAGDTAAFRKIYEYYQGRIFAFALAHTKSRETAEDAVQEVFIRLWERREQIQPELNFEAYVKVATRNQICNMLRTAVYDRKLQEKIMQNVEKLRHNPYDKLFEKELSRLQSIAIEKLSPQAKTVYLLSREQELTYHQIAEKLGISSHTVKNHMKKALKDIRKSVNNNNDIICLIIASIIARS